jgi:hypothetical protein
VDTRDKSVESNAKGKNTDKDFSKLSPIIKCYKCQGYGHVAANCPTPFRVAIDKLPATESKFISEELIIQVENYHSDEEIKGDEIEESNTSIALEVTHMTTELIDVSLEDNTSSVPKITPMITEPTDVSLEDNTSSIPEITHVITEFTVVSLEDSTSITPEITSLTIESIDVPSEDNTLNTLEVTPVITEIVDALDEDLTNMLPPTCEIQPAIELVPRVSLPDFGMEVVPHLETSEVPTSLEVKQQCLVPTDVHVYTDPFWNYVVTKDLGQINDVNIYCRSISYNLENTVEGESNTSQIFSSPSITVTPRGAFHVILPVRISLVLIFTITGRLLYTSRMRRLIIPFDRGRKN